MFIHYPAGVLVAHPLQRLAHHSSTLSTDAVLVANLPVSSIGGPLAIDVSGSHGH